MFNPYLFPLVILIALAARLQGDTISVGVVGTAGGVNNWPSAEPPEKAIDGVGQKYLNFGELNTGVIVTPAGGSSVATELTLWSASDAPQRDPCSYQVFGTNAALGPGPFDSSIFTLISQGPVTLPATRNGGGGAPLDPAASVSVSFSNTTAYTSYLILFPAVADGTSANSMQIAEIQLSGTGGGIFAPGDPILGVQADTPFTISVLDEESDIVNMGSPLISAANFGAGEALVVNGLAHGAGSAGGANLTTNFGFEGDFRNDASGLPDGQIINEVFDGIGGTNGIIMSISGLTVGKDYLFQAYWEQTPGVTLRITMEGVDTIPGVKEQEPGVLISYAFTAGDDTLNIEIDRDDALGGDPNNWLSGYSLQEQALLVTTATDEDDGNFDPANGDGTSLREAVNHAPAGTLITFDPSVFGVASPPTIQLTHPSGELLIDSALTIDASAIAGGVTVDGGSNDDFVLDPGETRCFLITDGDGANDVPVTLRNLVIRDGVYEGGDGGANIHNRENLTLDNCLITGGRAFGADADGGGIYSDGGSLTLTACTVSQNQTSGSGADGGGIFTILGTLTLTACTVSQNQTSGSGADGGGIYSRNGDLALTACTVSQNQSSADGGGIWSNTNLATQTATLTNCTFHGNSATARGGGYYNEDGLCRLIHCTVTGNIAAADSGGGIASYGDTVTRTELTATIVRDNTGGGVSNDVQFVVDPPNSDPIDTFQSFGVNHVGTGNALGNFFLITDRTGEDDPILLAPLGNYGGPTATRPPLPGSPARERTTTPTLLVTDQRGVPRFVGARESGAVEIQPTVVLNSDDSGPGSLRDTILFAAPTETVTFDPGFFCLLPAPPISLASEILIDKELTIDASGILEDVIVTGNSDGDFVLDPGETRCFLITDGNDANDLPVTLRNLVIRDGVYEGGDAGANIHNRENLTLNNCLITGGRAFGADADGGGIYSDGGSLTLTACTVSQNQTSGSGADGGGIYNNSGFLTLTACTVSQNQTSGPGAAGGGIFSVGGALTLTACTVSQNQASGSSAAGGGIYSNMNLDGQTATLTNCTLHNNTCSTLGGGYYNVDGLTRLIHCTVTGNSAATDSGGGIASYGDANTRTELTATIVRDNTGGGAANDVQHVVDTTNTFQSMDANLVGAGNGVSNFTESNDQTGTGTAAGLAPLGNYGGPTETRFPLAGSPAIDGAPGSPEMSDQRGLARNGTPDIGAVEASQLVVTTAVDENVALETGDGASLRECLAASPPGGTITFDETVFPATITLVNGNLLVDKSLTVDASAIPTGVTVSGDNTSRVFTIQSPTSPTVTLDSLHIRDGSVSGGVSPNDTGGNVFIDSGERLNLENCSVTDGTASAFGGGIGGPGTLDAENSTIARNSAGQIGGGILAGGLVTLDHCTVADNTADGATGGIRVASGGVLTLRNSIVADNRRDPAGTNTPDDLSGSFTSNGTSIVEVHSSGSSTGTVLAIDPFLAPLGSYGDGTPSLPPLPGSPVIEGAVAVGSPPPLDQLRNPRPGGPLPDIGAVEALPLAMLGLADTDGDGIPDILEGPAGPYAHLTVGTDDSGVDTDRDGSTDAEEIGNMTDLYDIDDRLKITSFVPGPSFHPFNNPNFDLTFTSFPGLTYTVESNQALTNFSAPAFRTFEANGFTTTRNFFYLPNLDFVRIRRNE